MNAEQKAQYLEALKILAVVIGGALFGTAMAYLIRFVAMLSAAMAYG